MNAQKTYSAKPNEVSRDWYVIDADGQTLGRLASKISRMIMGKHKPTYTAHVDTGDFVVVINAKKIRVTGNRMTEKVYFSHSLYPGGDRRVLLRDQLEKNPERVIRDAVWGMMNKHKLGKKQIKKLKVYGEAEHPHEAQKPKAMAL